MTTPQQAIYFTVSILLFSVFIWEALSLVLLAAWVGIVSCSLIVAAGLLLAARSIRKHL